MPDLDEGIKVSDEALAEMIAAVYRGEWDIDVVAESRILDETRAIFRKAVDKGVPRSTPHRKAFKERLNESVDVFATFRVHNEADEIARMLTDEEGRRRSFRDWAERVQPYLNHQNRAWLQTEYSTAIRRAHDEAEWERFMEDADIYPNLEWMPSTSAQPGADHKIFWGTVLSKDDPFWSEHRPGDRWNCKCSLRQTDKEADKPGVRWKRGKGDEPQAGLRTKPGSGEIFSDDHPYFPKSCGACPYGSQAGRLRTLFASLGGNDKNCNTCKRAWKRISQLGENAQRARRAANEKLRKDMDKWADSNLPSVTVGKFAAKRDVVRGIVVNKKTMREVFTKNVGGEHLKEVLEMLKHYKEWMGKMVKVRTEPAKHHKNAVFNVYNTEYGGRQYEVKTKAENGCEQLYTIKKADD